MRGWNGGWHGNGGGNNQGGRRRNYPGGGYDRPGAGYGGLAIVQAAYGADNRVIDVTDRVRAQVSGNQLSVRAGNDLAGYDPRPGTPKGAVGHVPIGGREYQVSVRSRNTCACLDGWGGHRPAPCFAIKRAASACE